MNAIQNTLQALGLWRRTHPHGVTHIEMATFQSESERLNPSFNSSNEVTYHQLAVACRQPDNPHEPVTIQSFVVKRRSTVDLSTIARHSMTQGSWYDKVLGKFRRRSSPKPKTADFTRFVIGNDDDKSEKTSTLMDNAQSPQNSNSNEQFLDQLFPKMGNLTEAVKEDSKSNSCCSTYMDRTSDSGNDADIEDSDDNELPRGRYYRYFGHDESLSEWDQWIGESYV